MGLEEKFWHQITGTCLHLPSPQFPLSAWRGVYAFTSHLQVKITWILFGNIYETQRVTAENPPHSPYSAPSPFQVPGLIAKGQVHPASMVYMILGLGTGTSLGAQWWRACLPMQETWVQSLTQEDPTCYRATKPMWPQLPSLCFSAREPQLLKPMRPRASTQQQEKSL